MPFGQWLDIRVSDLDAAYCQWLLTAWSGREKLSATLRSALEERVKVKAEECSR